MKHGTKVTSAVPPSKRYRPDGSRITEIIGIVGMLWAIAVEYQRALAAEETYRRLRSSCSADFSRSGLRRDQQALVIKRLYCDHKQ